MVVEDGGVDVDRKTAGLRSLDRGYGAIEHALLRDGLVVVLAETIEMHREEQIRRRLEQIELLLEQQRVGAKRDELLARHQATHDLADLLVDQGLAAGNGDHGGTALVSRVPALLCRHAAVQDGVWIIDLAAAGTRQVAAEQRLQHQHQRIAFAAEKLLLHQIGPDTHFLEEGDCHNLSSFWTNKRISPRPTRPAGGIRYFFPPWDHRDRNWSDAPKGLDNVANKHFPG